MPDIVQKIVTDDLDEDYSIIYDFGNFSRPILTIGSETILKWAKEIKDYRKYRKEPDKE